MGTEASSEKPDARFEGYLNKRSRYKGELRKRWIVLTKDKLYSYKSKDMKNKPTEVLDLNHYNELEICKGDILSLFALISPKCKREFVASSIATMNDWMMEIQRTINALTASILDIPYLCNIQPL